MKRQQCPIETVSKTAALSELFDLEASGLVEVYFGDASGFWQTPVVARAWQFANEEIRIVPKRGGRLAVFGFLSKANVARTWTSKKSIKTRFVVDCIDEWVPERLGLAASSDIG